MRKFLTGFVSGVFVLLSGYLVADNAVQAPSADNDYVADPSLSYPWTGMLSVQKLHKNAATPTPNPNENDYPILSLTTDDPLLKLSRADIQNVCLSFFGNAQDSPSQEGFAVEIYLKPDARRNIGAILKNRDSKAHSFRLVGFEVANFVTDGTKAARFEERADHYPRIEDLPPFADFAGDEAALDAAVNDTRPDIAFHVPYSAAYAGLNYAKFASGTNELETCDPERSVQEAAGYNTHKKMWEATLKQYAGNQ